MKILDASSVLDRILSRKYEMNITIDYLDYRHCWLISANRRHKLGYYFAYHART